MLILCVFNALNNTKKQRKFNITTYGENFYQLFNGIKFKIWRVTILKSFLPLKILDGWMDELVF